MRPLVSCALPDMDLRGRHLQDVSSLPTVIGTGAACVNQAPGVMKPPPRPNMQSEASERGCCIQSFAYKDAKASFLFTCAAEGSALLAIITTR